MKKEKMVILGAGGMGRELLFFVSESSSYNILGFIDNDHKVHGKMINGFPVLGDDSWLLKYPDEISCVIAVGDPKIRKQVFEKFYIKENIVFPNIIANGVKYSDTVKMGQGCIIGPFSLLSVDILIGDFVLLNNYCQIAHDVRIDDFVTLYGNASVSGSVVIGESAEIGAGTRIIQGISIGEYSKVGIGSVVINDVPPNCTVFGNPAKRII